MGFTALPSDRTSELTPGWYEREADAYYRSTVNIDLGPFWDRFLERVTAGGRILDAGSGSGRDTLHFLKAGFRVDAFDASPKLAALSTRLTGVTTAVDTFEHWVGRPNRYDGIWAFASLLHVDQRDLPEVVGKLASSLKSGGVLFASFKRGERATVDERGRCYTNLTPTSLRVLLNNAHTFSKIEIWEDCARAAHGETTGWVYVLAVRAAA